MSKELLLVVDAVAHEKGVPESVILDAIEAALASAAKGPNRVPFALTQHELIGSVHELQASALSRYSKQATNIRSFLISRGVGRLQAQTAAYAALGAIVAAGQAWAEAGTGRGEVEPYLRETLAPVVAGFASGTPDRRTPVI